MLPFDDDVIDAAFAFALCYAPIDADADANAFGLAADWGLGLGLGAACGSSPAVRSFLEERSDDNATTATTT
jgi:hypothetical protein